MAGVGQLLRWGSAVVVALLAYAIAFVVGYFMWRRFGGDPADASRWILAIATLCAVLAGAFTVAREKRKAAALALWFLAALFPIALLAKNTLAGHFTTTNLFEFGGTMIGGLAAYYVVRVAPLSAPKAEG